MSNGRLSAERASTIGPTATPSFVATPTAEQGIAIGPVATDFTAPAASTRANMTGAGCMTLQQALVAMECIANPAGPGCQAWSPQELAMPWSSPALSMPLCPGETPPPLPSCADADALKGIAYCDQYGASGPNAPLNALCWFAQKYPSWYASMKALPECGATPGGGPGGGGAVKEEEKNQALVWGGILVALLLVGGGVYYYTKKKK